MTPYDRSEAKKRDKKDTYKYFGTLGMDLLKIGLTLFIAVMGFQIQQTFEKARFQKDRVEFWDTVSKNKEAAWMAEFKLNQTFRNYTYLLSEFKNEVGKSKGNYSPKNREYPKLKKKFDELSEIATSTSPQSDSITDDYQTFLLKYHGIAEVLEVRGWKHFSSYGLSFKERSDERFLRAWAVIQIKVASTEGEGVPLSRIQQIEDNCLKFIASTQQDIYPVSHAYARLMAVNGPPMVTELDYFIQEELNSNPPKKNR